MGNNVHCKNHCVGTGFKPVPTGASAGQVTMEYAIIFAVMLAAIFATGIIDRSRHSFGAYLTKANDAMTVIREGTAAEAAGRKKAGGGEVAVGREVGGTGDSGQPQDDGMASIVKVAGDAKVELAGLKETYSDKKERYDKIRELPIIGLFMPEFDETRDGKLLKVRIGAYEKVIEVTSPLIKGE